MARISEPKPRLSAADKKLLKLVAEILLENLEGTAPSNTDTSCAALTDEEAQQVLVLLQEITSSKDFLQSWWFVNGLAGRYPASEETLREIYLSARKRHGKTRAMASRRWSEFTVRLGYRSRSVYPRGARPMPFDHFLAMERRLFEALGIHPKVIEVLLAFVDAQRDAVEASRHGQARSRTPDASTKPVWQSLKQQVAKLFGDKFRREISRERLAALFVIVANSSVIFTTRDWDVAGTLSAMAGAAPLVFPDDTVK